MHSHICHVTQVVRTLRIIYLLKLNFMYTFFLYIIQYIYSTIIKEISQNIKF
ncbi:hypothetical protein ACJX0J_023171, partial [Zea mays]